MILASQSYHGKTEVKKALNTPTFSMSCVTKFPSPFSTWPSFSAAVSIEALLADLYIPQQGCIFLLDHLCLLASTFYVSVWSGAPCWPMWASCHLCLISCAWGWTILQLGRSDPSKSASSPGPLFSLSLSNIVTNSCHSPRYTVWAQVVFWNCPLFQLFRVSSLKNQN